MQISQLFAMTVSAVMVFSSADGAKLYASTNQKFQNGIAGESLDASVETPLQAAPRGTEFNISRINGSLYKEIQEKVNKNGRRNYSTMAYSFNFTREGKKFQPYGKANVRLHWRKAVSPKKGSKISVYKVISDGKNVKNVEDISGQSQITADSKHRLSGLKLNLDDPGRIAIVWSDPAPDYSHSMSYAGKDFKVSLNYDNDAEILKSDKLKVKELDADDYDHYSDAAAQKVLGDRKADSDDLSTARLFDVKITDENGKVKEPEAPVDVKFSFGSGKADLADYQVVHFKDNSVKKAQLMDPETSGNKTLKFTADSFSLYEIVKPNLLNSGTDVTNTFKKKVDKNAEYEIVNVTGLLPGGNGKAYALNFPKTWGDGGNSATLYGKSVDLSDKTVSDDVTRWKISFNNADALIDTAYEGKNYRLNIDAKKSEVNAGNGTRTGVTIKSGKQITINGKRYRTLLVYKENAHKLIKVNGSNADDVSFVASNTLNDNNDQKSIDPGGELNASCLIFRKINPDGTAGDFVDTDAAVNGSDTANDPTYGMDVTSAFLNSLDLNKGYALVNVASILTNDKRTGGLAAQYNGDDNIDMKPVTVLSEGADGDGYVYKSNIGNPFNNTDDQGDANDGVTKWHFERRGKATNIYTLDDDGKRHYLDIDDKGNVKTITSVPDAGLSILRGRLSSGLNSFSIFKKYSNGYTRQIRAYFDDGGPDTGVARVLGSTRGDGVDNSLLNDVGFVLCTPASGDKQLKDAHIGTKQSISDITKDMKSSGTATRDGSATEGNSGKKVIVYTRDDDGNYYALAYGNRTDDNGKEVQWRYLKKLYNNGDSIGYRGNEDAIWTLKKEDYNGENVYNLYDQGQTGSVKSLDREQDKVTINDGAKDVDVDRTEGDNRFYPLVLSGADSGKYCTTIMRADYADENRSDNKEQLEKDVAKRYPLRWSEDNDAKKEADWASSHPMTAGALENVFITSSDKQEAVSEGVDDIDLNYSDKTYSSFTAGSGTESIGYNWYFAVIDTDSNGKEIKDRNNGAEISTIKTVDSIKKGIKINMFDYDGTSDSKGYYWNADKTADHASGTGPIQGQLLGRTFIDSKYDGQDIVQGLASEKLENGYPSVSETTDAPKAAKGASMDELFDPVKSQSAPNTTQPTKVFENCNHLFSQNIYDETGYLEYSSFNNFAHLSGAEDGADHASGTPYNFKVYDQIATPYAYYRSQDSTTEVNDENKNKWLNTTVLSSRQFERGNFLPFNDIRNDGSKVQTVDSYNALPRTQQQTADTLSEVEYAPDSQLIDQNMQSLNHNDPNFGKTMYRILHPNYRIGMTMDANFYQPIGVDRNGAHTNAGEDPDHGNRPITFEFDGDDDLWLYIDGVLVLDMGGVHDAHKGVVNFKTGDVTVSTYGKTVKDVEEKTTNLKQIFSQVQGDKFNADGFTSEVGDSSRGTFTGNSVHKLQMFYMERGEGASNLSLKTNIKQSDLSVSKAVTDSAGKSASTSSLLPDAVKERLAHTEFYFRVYDYEENRYYNIDDLNKAAKESGTPLSGYRRNGEQLMDKGGNAVPVKTASGDGTVFILYGGYSAEFPNMIHSNHIRIEELPWFNQNSVESDDATKYPFTVNDGKLSISKGAHLTPLNQMFGNAEGIIKADNDTVGGTGTESSRQVSIDQNTESAYSGDDYPLSVKADNQSGNDSFEFTNQMRPSVTADIRKLEDGNTSEKPVSGAEYTLYHLNNAETAESDDNTYLNRGINNNTLPAKPSDGQTISLKGNYDAPLYTLGESASFDELSDKSDDRYIADTAKWSAKDDRWNYTVPEGTVYETKEGSGYFYKKGTDVRGLQLVPNTTYIFRETKAPKGYDTSSDVWAVKVVTDKNNISKVHIRCLTSGDGKETVIDADPYTVKDKPGISLPVTGQSGIMGSLLAAGALVAYSSYKVLKKRKEDDEA